MKQYLVSANGHEFAVYATTRRAAIAATMLEMLRSGMIRLLDFDAENVAHWRVEEVA